jgi:hypothetical protein
MLNVASPFSNTAQYISLAFDDTLKAYIDRAINTLDIAIYSFDATNTGLISAAINDAYNRGVQSSYWLPMAVMLMRDLPI